MWVFNYLIINALNKITKINQIVMVKGTKDVDFKGKTLHIIHNNEKAPYFGSQFGQDVEPTGYFCVQKELDVLQPNYEEKKIILFNPIMIDVSEDSIAWKLKLSNIFKLKNKKLTAKLQKDGYDGIITFDKSPRYFGLTGEIIVFDIKFSETS